MATTIALIILGLSLLGILFILIRKMPLLAQLPKNEIVSEPFLARMKDRMKPAQLVKNFPIETILHKLLSKMRIISLKLENKSASWLTALRARSLKKKNPVNDTYWEDLKKK